MEHGPDIIRTPDQTYFQTQTSSSNTNSFNTNTKMGHSAATQDEAFEATTRSVGCVVALLPRISLKARWFRKEEQGVSARWSRKEEQVESNSKAERSASHAPCVVETDSTLSDLLDSRSNAASDSAKTLSFFTRRSNAASDSAKTLSDCSEISSSAEGQNVEEVKTSTRTNDETWAVMRRRFQNAHRGEQGAATQASTDGGVPAPVQQKAREPTRARSEEDLWMWGPPPWLV